MKSLAVAGGTVSALIFLFCFCFGVVVIAGAVGLLVLRSNFVAPLFMLSFMLGVTVYEVLVA